MAERMVVLQTRVPVDLMAKIQAMAAVRGMSEAEVARMWLQSVADTVSEESLEEILEADLALERTRRRAAFERARSRTGK